jgi:uncharacterized protein YndB with AHSA1/START domain
MRSDRAVSDRHGSAVVTLPSDTEILIVRAFDAPAERVFEAWTTPELVRRWWACETSDWLVCEIDLRVGGRWRWVFREGDMEIGFHGEYREIARPHRLVMTEMFEGAPDAADADAPVNTVTFEEADAVTTMSVRVQAVSQEQRDAIIASGMESGMQVSYDRLEDLVRRVA